MRGKIFLGRTERGKRPIGYMRILVAGDTYRRLRQQACCFNESSKIFLDRRQREKRPMSDMGSLGQLPPKWESNVDEVCTGHFTEAAMTPTCDRHFTCYRATLYSRGIFYGYAPVCLSVYVCVCHTSVFYYNA